MKKLLLGLTVALLSVVPATAQEPTCKNCPATYIPNEEINVYLKQAMAERIVDQQVRAVDVGKSHVAVGLVHRTRLEAPARASVAEHDLVSEVYHVISGSATLVTGPDLVGKARRPADNTAVRMLNGPGNNAESVRNGATHQLKAGDVIVIRRHRTLVHQDRRPHHVPDDSHRSRQGRAAQGRGGLEGRFRRQVVNDWRLACGG